MSDHLREHYVAMLESINHDIVDRIARGRKISERAGARRRRASACSRRRGAMDAGLVDRLVPWVGAKAALERRAATTTFEFVDVDAEEDERKNRNIMS